MINKVQYEYKRGIIMVNQEKCEEYFDAEEFEKAIACFDQLLSDDPDNIELIYGKASALLENEEFERAVISFDQILLFDGQKC
jgi:tetratricopeptide (TPR) repeat protein